MLSDVQIYVGGRWYLSRLRRKTVRTGYIDNSKQKPWKWLRDTQDACVAHQCVAPSGSASR